MRIPDPTLIQAQLTPAPAPPQPPPVAAPIPVTPPPSVGSDLLHLSANATALGAAGTDDSSALRQWLVSGLLQLLAGEQAFASGLTIGAQTPSTASSSPPPSPSPDGGDNGPGDLRLPLSVRVLAADGSRMALRAELVLHPGLLRYAPALAALLAESTLGTGAGVPVMQLPLPQLPAPQVLGYHLLLNPASLWPLSVTIASGQLRLVAADDAAEDEPEGADTPPVGARVRNWLELHRERMRRR